MQSFLNIFLYRILAILQHLKRAFPQKPHFNFLQFQLIHNCVSGRILTLLHLISRFIKLLQGFFPQNCE